MVWLRVQRSGRTSMRATTRSFPASVNVTPFNSANGIFIELTFSSGVMIGNPPILLQASYAGLTRVSINLRQNIFEMMDCWERRQVYVVCARQTTMPGNDV